MTAKSITAGSGDCARTRGRSRTTLSTSSPRDGCPAGTSSAGPRVVGIAVPALGSILAACGSSASRRLDELVQPAGGAPGATIKAGIVTPTAAINPVTVADQGGLDMLAQTGEYLCLSTQTLTLKPVLATSWTPNATADVWTFKIRQGVKFHNGAPLTADDVVYTYKLQTNPKGGSNALSAFGGVLSPSGWSRSTTSRCVPAGRPERELPVPDLLRQLQHDHHPERLQPGEWQSTFIGTGPFKLGSYTPKVGRHVHPQRVVLGHQGAALGDPVHLLRHAGRVDPGADRRHHRRARPVRGTGGEALLSGGYNIIKLKPARTASCPCAATRPRSPTRGSGRPSRSR